MADLGRIYKDRRNALGMASPADQQFARRAQERTAPIRAELAKRNPASGAVDVLLALGGDKQAQDSVLNKVDEGLSGMMMGYTKNGIPHNDPRVMNAYIKNIENRFKDTGITPKSRILDDTVMEGRKRIHIDFEKDGQIIGKAVRGAEPEGIYMESLDSALPEGVKMGVMPHLYPAEAQFGRIYGGELDGTFKNAATHSGFLRSNPEAQGNNLVGYLKAKYKGLMDFPVD